MIHDRTLRLILFVALAIRATVALLALQRGTTDSSDTVTYVRPAKSLVAVGRFDSDRTPELSRTPGYPILIAVGELAGHAIPTTVALQVILSTATTFGVAILALAMRSTPRVGVLAAAIYALEPTGIIYVSKILTETMFAAAVTGGLVLLTLWARDAKRVYLVAAAAVFCAAGFVRPIAYFAPVPLAAVVGFIAWRYQRASVRGAVLSSGMFFVIAAAPLVAWRIRNAVVADYDNFAAISDVNLLYYRAAGVVARRSGKMIDSVQVQMHRELDVDAPLLANTRLARGQERTARYHEMRRRARAILVGDPPAVALDWAAGAARTVFGRETSEWARLMGLGTLTRPWRIVRLSLTVLWLPLLVLAVVGLVRVRWDVSLVLPALVVCAYLVVLGAGPEAYSRFRVPVAPVICVFTAAGALQLRQGAAAWRDRRRRLT